MEIHPLNKKHLEAFIYSKEYEALEHIPITRHRAISQINNPRASDEDILLILAFEESNLAGYLGILPDYLYDQDHSFKVGWLSCIWINPNYRRKGIAQELLDQAFTSWGHQLLATDFTPEARNLYDKYGKFETLRVNHGIRLYHRLNLQQLLQPKHRVFRSTKLIWRGIDRIGNALLSLRLAGRYLKGRRYRLEYLNYIDYPAAEFIKHHQSDELCKRNSEALNWMLQHPWILQAPQKDEMGKKYAFTAVAESFNFLPIKILDENRSIKGFLILSVINGHLKVPYAYWEKEAKDWIVQTIVEHMKLGQVNMVTIFNEALARTFAEQRNGVLYKKHFERTYLASQQLIDALPTSSLYFQDGDGDCAFT